MPFLWNSFLFILLLILGLIVLIMLIGAWPFFTKKSSEPMPDNFSLPSLDEIETNSAKKLQRRLVFLFALLTITGFFLGGQCKGEEDLKLKVLYWLGMILIAIAPMLLLFVLDDKVALVLSRKRVLLVELAVIVISGVAELVYFRIQNDGNDVPLRSFKGATLFLSFLAIWGYLFFRMSRLIKDSEG
jgi:hypothetical protein